MGGKAKIILPLVALGAATGGFGLFGAGAGVSAAGAGLAADAGLTGLGAAGEFALASAGASTGLTGAAALAESAGLAGLGSVGEFGSVASSVFPAPITATGSLAAPTSTGFFAQIGQNIANLTPLEKINFAFSGINAVAQQNALAAQENESKLSEANSRLDLANKDLDTQRSLQKSLATQSNFFAASGINASRGSASQLQNNAFGNASLAQDKVTAGRSLLAARTQIRRQNFRGKRGDINRDFASSTYSTLFDKKKPVI